MRPLRWWRAFRRAEALDYYWVASRMPAVLVTGRMPVLRESSAGL